MSNVPGSRFPNLLSLAVHEFRGPLTTGPGYIRMLLTGRAGELTGQQCNFLEEVAKSFAKLSGLVAEMSDLSNLEASTTKFNRGEIDLRSVLADAIAGLPGATEGAVDVNLTTGPTPAIVHGDALLLKKAFAAILTALRRELLASTALEVRERVEKSQGQQRAAWIAFADSDHIESLVQASPDALTTFDELRGGCGFILPVARRIIAGHGGAVWSPAEGSKTAAVVMLPLS